MTKPSMRQIRRIKIVDKIFFRPVTKAKIMKVNRIIYSKRFVTFEVSLRGPKGGRPRHIAIYSHGIGIMNAKGKVKRRHLFQKSKKKS